MRGAPYDWRYTPTEAWTADLKELVENTYMQYKEKVAPRAFNIASLEITVFECWNCHCMLIVMNSLTAHKMCYEDYLARYVTTDSESMGRSVYPQAFKRISTSCESIRNTKFACGFQALSLRYINTVKQDNKCTI